MSEIERNNIEFVTPPEYSHFDIENFVIKLQSFGMGDKVHTELNDCSTADAWFEIAKMQGGWTQEMKDNFMAAIVRIKTRIINLEEERAKSLGL